MNQQKVMKIAQDLHDTKKELRAVKKTLKQYKSLVKKVDADNLPAGRILLNDNGFVSLGFLDFNKVNNEVRISYSNMTSFIVDKGAHYIEQTEIIKLMGGEWYE